MKKMLSKLLNGPRSKKSEVYEGPLISASTMLLQDEVFKSIRSVSSEMSLSRTLKDNRSLVTIEDMSVCLKEVLEYVGILLSDLEIESEVFLVDYFLKSFNEKLLSRFQQ